MLTETRYAAADGGVIAYQIFGRGDFDLVIAGGFPWHIELHWEQPGFARLLERLAGFARVIVFDRRGVGLSDPPRGADTLDDRADDLRCLLGAVGSEEASFVSFGEGGLAVMQLAATSPALVRSLVLIAAYARLTRTKGYEAGLAPEEFEASVSHVGEVWGTGGWAASLFPSSADDPLFRRWAARVERYAATPTRAVAAWRHVGSLDARSVLSRIEAPTLVVTRADNRGHGRGHGAYLAEHIPDAKVLELPGEAVGSFFDADPSEADEIQDFLIGVRADPEPGRALVAILFTDIVDSTQAVAATGDRPWRDVLDRHDEVTAQQVTRFGGRVVKGTGDGTVATFPSPRNALRCAWALHEHLDTIGLRIRAGAHVGEIELRGDDIAGFAVHVAQRVSSLAGAGEVVVSQTLRDLLGRGDARVTHRGHHRLKGVDEEWTVHLVEPAEPT